MTEAVQIALIAATAGVLNGIIAAVIAVKIGNRRDKTE